MFDFGNMFNGMFKPVARGYCKISMDGQIAIKTTSGYKTFDPKTHKLINCSDFAFDMDEIHNALEDRQARLAELKAKQKAKESKTAPKTTAKKSMADLGF